MIKVEHLQEPSWDWASFSVQKKNEAHGKWLEGKEKEKGGEYCSYRVTSLVQDGISKKRSHDSVRYEETEVRNSQIIHRYLKNRC